MRPKDTSRVEARRRYRDEQRAADVDTEASDAAAAEATAASPTRSPLALPDIRADLVALPGVLLTRWMWVPFVMLIVAFVLVLALQGDALPVGAAQDLAALYVSLTLPATSLFVFFIGGFLAPRASYLVGAILGAFDALLFTLLWFLVPDAFQDQALSQSGLTTGQAGGESMTSQTLVSYWGIAILVGVLAAAFAAWYRRFLRSSQERARANRMAREQEQARKAKEEARAARLSAKDARKTR